MFRFAFQRQVRLRHDSDDVVLPVHHWNAPHLVLLHQLPAMVDVLAIAAGDWLRRNELLDRSCLGIQTSGNHRAAKIPIGDHSQQLLRLLIAHYRNGADIALAHHSRNQLRAIAGKTTNRTLTHYFLDLHRYLQLFPSYCETLMSSTTRNPLA